MAEHTRTVAPALIARYDFSRFGTLVDLGGGDGTLISAILAAVPALHGILFDLPAGVESAAKTLDAAGVADRCQVVTGNYFATVPDGADAYLLKSVIHDWDDERAVAVLRTCRRAVPATGRVLVVEPVLAASVESTELTLAVLSDINMMVNTGGRERTEDQFRAMFAAAGFALTALGLAILGPPTAAHAIASSRSISPNARTSAAHLARATTRSWTNSPPSGGEGVQDPKKRTSTGGRGVRRASR